MKPEDRILILAILLTAVAGGGAGYLTGEYRQGNLLRRDAIEAGVGQWRADPVTGKTYFVFTQPKKK